MASHGQDELQTVAWDLASPTSFSPSYSHRATVSSSHTPVDSHLEAFTPAVPFSWNAFLAVFRAQSGKNSAPWETSPDPQV